MTKTGLVLAQSSHSPPTPTKSMKVVTKKGSVEGNTNFFFAQSLWIKMKGTHSAVRLLHVVFLKLPLK